MSNNIFERNILARKDRPDSELCESTSKDIPTVIVPTTVSNEFMSFPDDDQQVSDLAKPAEDSDRDALNSIEKIPFTEFYTKNYLHFKRLAFLMVNNREVAEDAVQDSFLAIYPKYQKLDNPDGYLRIVVINRCKTALKKRVYDNKKMSKIASISLTDGETHSNSSEFLDQLDVLSVKQKTAIILRYYLRFSDPQIARIIKCRPVSVSKIVSRALDSLKTTVDLNQF